MLADMAARTEAARHLTHYAAWLADNKINNTRDSSFAKYLATDAAMLNSIDCIHILGGYGYINEFPAEKLMRDAKLLQIIEIDSDLHQCI